MNYNFTGDKLSVLDQISVAAVEEILTDQRDGMHFAAWEIVTLRKRLQEAGIPCPGGFTEKAEV